MKASILLPCAAAVGSAIASSDAYLWTVDSSQIKSSTNQVSTTSSSTAERILARRKGVTDSAYLHITDESTLSDLNEYGGWQQPLFGASPSEPPAKIFIRISGYEGAVSEFNTLPDLWIEDAETSLLDTFEARFDTKNICEYHIKPRTKAGVSIKYSYFEMSKQCLSQNDIESLPSMLAILATVPTASTVAGKGVSTFHRTLIHLAATENIESTLLVLPSTTLLKKPRKSELKKRAETPLDLPFESASEGRIAVSNRTGNATLPRNIPQYFSSESACNNQTNSCSGHGKCVKTHGSQFRCACAATIVRENGDGTTKSVQWGGNACQKKDISFQFILFAGFGIFFTAVVAGAIGMLFSMGSEPLPSVIGAGVVGPRAQR